MKTLLAVIGIALTIAACATRNNVSNSPLPGQTAEQHHRDIAECRSVAESRSDYSPASETAKGAGVGAAVGALGGAAAGAAIGAVTGGNVGKSAAIGAGAGAATGAVGGGYYKYSRDRNGYDAAYADCMRAKGY